MLPVATLVAISTHSKCLRIGEEMQSSGERPITGSKFRIGVFSWSDMMLQSWCWNQGDNVEVLAAGFVRHWQIMASDGLCTGPTDCGLGRVRPIRGLWMRFCISPTNPSSCNWGIGTYGSGWALKGLSHPVHYWLWLGNLIQQHGTGFSVSVEWQKLAALTACFPNSHRIVALFVVVRTVCYVESRCLQYSQKHISCWSI